jgi:hypothetical protein
VTEQSWLGLNPELARKPRSIKSLAEKVEPQNTPLKLADPLTKLDLQNMAKAVLTLGDYLTESIKGDGNTLKQVQHEIENLTVSLGRFTDVVLKALETKQEGPNAVLEREVLLKINRELDESHGKDKLQYSR